MSKLTLAELREHVTTTHRELEEAIAEAIHRTGCTEAEIDAQLESQDTVVPHPMDECDPDGSLRRLYKRLRAAKTALDKAEQKIPG